MSLKDVIQEETKEVFKKVSLVNVKFGSNDSWIAVGILCSDESSIELLIDLKKSKYIVEYGEDILIRFQKNEYEYIYQGEITEISFAEPVTATVMIKNGFKHINKRKFVRYDTDFDGYVNGENKVGCNVLNLSIGGTMFESNAFLEGTIPLSIVFSKSDVFNTKVQIVRCIKKDNGKFSYGCEFIELDRENDLLLRRQLMAIEKKHFEGINSIRYVKGNTYRTDAKVAIFSLCSQENLEIKEALASVGVSNYSVFHNFNVYMDFLTEENPKFVIVEIDEITDTVYEGISNIHSNFPSIKVIVVLPLDYYSMELEKSFQDKNIELITKPFILNEFESIIVKHI